MLQLQYPTFDQSMMVGPSSNAQLDRVQDSYRSSHSSYHTPQRTPSSSEQPRQTPSRLATPAQVISSQSTSSTSPSVPNSTTTTSSTTSENQQKSSQAATPQIEKPPPTIALTPEQNPTTTLQNSSSASSPSIAQPSPLKHRRTSSLQAATPIIPPPIKLRDLAHVVEIANADLSNSREPSAKKTTRQSEVRYEISGMPVADVIEMVAALLTKITTTNDKNHENLHRNIPPTEVVATLPLQTTSVLAFHGKNIPTITIQSYLSRIHKYCPTTYEVFLSLLVYFDRMTERVNAKLLPKLQENESPPQTGSGTPTGPGTQSMPASPPPGEASLDEPYNMTHYFVVDSFNIHRLVIAGVTCASKFFSDVFYTNSRYAKVGGLPLVELNHLELQFLLLNDFRLSIPVEELEAYGTMLVQFYAREEVTKQQTKMQQPPAQQSQSPTTEK